jgi:hypothetical protein
MVDFPLVFEEVGSSPASGKHSSPRHTRRHTIPDVKAEFGRLSKKDRRSLQRALSPQLSSEDVAAGGTPKASKKLKKVQRGKERDDKSGFLQNSADASPLMPELSRTASVSGHIGGREYMDFIGQKPVTESLNPSSLHRAHRGRLRRTNSEVHIGSSKELRCPPERKQFYRQFMKSIKLYGISNTATSRLETPAPSSMPRFHSENLALSNPYSPKMERLWLELQAYLRDRSPEMYEEMLFYTQVGVDSVLKKIVHFSCTDLDCTQSLTALKFPTREGNEQMHTSYSTPSFGVVKQAGTMYSGYQDALGVVLPKEAVPPKEAAPPGAAEVCPVDGSTPSALFVPPCGLQWCVVRETLRDGSATEGSDLEHSGSNDCKLEYQDFLSFLQQRALMEVDSLLCELDEKEGLFNNRKRMGDEHPTYRTKFFKRRVCALNLYHKVTHGLAENLCQLSKWLGMPVLLPDICVDSLADSPEIARRTNPSSSCSLKPPSSPSSPRQVRVVDSSSCMAHEGSGPPQSPLTISSKPQFHVGSLDDSADSLTRSVGGTSQDVPVAETQVSSGDSIPKLKSQESRQEPYREFISRALKRKGIATTVVVSLCVCGGGGGSLGS